MYQLTRLPTDGFCNAGMAMPQSAHRDTCKKIKIAFALIIKKNTPFTLDHDGRVSKIIIYKNRIIPIFNII
jgi:hypothetical protein